MRIDTLVIVRHEGRVLLGMKLRGFAEGKWNGFGGKVEIDRETVKEAARRELFEECQISVAKLVHRGTLHFSFEHDSGLCIDCRIFEGTGIEGDPSETEEMRPQWFLENDIPYHQMWKDDRHWLPLLLKGEEFNGKFHLSEAGEILHGELNGEGVTIP